MSERVCEQVRLAVFEVLDYQEQLSGDECGAIATEAEATAGGTTCARSRRGDSWTS